MMKKAWIIIALTGGFILFGGCTKRTDPDFLGSGTLEADEVVVSSLLMGTLDSIAVLQGDSVRSDQVLALMDVEKLKVQLRQNAAMQEEVAANIRAAKARADQSARQHSNIVQNLTRQQALLETGNSTQQVVDDLTTQEAVAFLQVKAALDQIEALKAKKAQLEAAAQLIQLQLQDGEIKAPRSGVVIEKYVEAGENLSPGSPVVKIADLDRMKIRVYLSETDVGAVKLGTAVEIRVDALPDHPFKGTVTWISPRAEFTPKNVQTRTSRADLVFAVEAEFANPGHTAMIGMPAEVYLAK